MQQLFHFYSRLPTGTSKIYGIYVAFSLEPYPGPKDLRSRKDQFELDHALLVNAPRYFSIPSAGSIVQRNCVRTLRQPARE
jgi:hypothetical protein